MKSAATPAPGEIGHNSLIPTPEQITFEMEGRFADMKASKADLLASARALPEKITSKDELGNASRVIISMRELAKTAEGTREAEKSPYWRGGLAVDAFFKAELIDPLNKAGLILGRRVNDYQQAQLAAEREARRKAEIETARIAEEARLKAERARKEETKAAAEVQAAVAERRADEAAEAAQATPAGMVRERFADGPLVTMKTIKYVEIVDIKAIPLDELRPYLKPADIEAAVKRWAVVNDYAGTLPGVKCGEREESVVR
jgi:hypothetical protein